MDEATLAIMARMDNIRDNVTDVQLRVSSISTTLDKHDEQLENLEDIAGSTNDIMQKISEDLTDIKKGPVYSLDRFITKRVAQTTGGLGLIGLFAWSIAVGIL